MLGDLFRALRDMLRPGALGVLAAGVALSAGLLAAFYAALVVAIGWIVPDQVTLPWIGTVDWIDNLLSWGSAALMLVLSFFLMVPVASAFTGLFLERVAAMVEARHYPGLPEPRRVGLAETTRESLAFLGVMLAVNAVALIGYFTLGPLAPLLFWAVNGYLLGREYFQMAAMRRMPRAEAAALFRAHRLRIWASGVAMAAPLSVPVLNLIVPVLGAAGFTHVYHSLAGTRRG